MADDLNLGASDEEGTLRYWKVNDDMDFEVPNNLPSSESENTTTMLEVVKYVEKYERMPTKAVDFCTGPFAARWITSTT